MKQRTMKIDEELMIFIQKIKTAYFEKHHRIITLSDVIQGAFDQDILIMNLIKNNK